jgi:hypothetical protein
MEHRAESEQAVHRPSEEQKQTDSTGKARKSHLSF